MYQFHKRHTTLQRGFRHQKKLKTFPGFLSFIDSTEQPIPRPVDKDGRKMYYFGKKKRHTIKNQIMVNNHGLIIHKVAHKKGKRHDYDAYKKNHLITPPQVVNIIDLG